MTREEIADALDVAAYTVQEPVGLARIADAVRALPVINKCSDCFWLAVDMTPRGHVGICVHESLDGRGMVIGRVDAAPPSECPLRGGR